MVTEKYLTESIVTFFLVFNVGMASGAFAPFAVAAVLAAFIYAGGHISGGHYNPAVTLGAWMRGALPQQHVAPYMAAQCVGALGAAGLYFFLMNPAAANLPVLVPKFVLTVEFLYSFVLVFVALNTTTVKATTSNSYFGLAIGLTVLAGAYAVGGISSAVFNPAVALGLVVMKKLSLSSLWMYLVATLAGGACAAYAFGAVNNHGKRKV